MSKKKTVKRRNKFNFFIYFILTICIAAILGWGIKLKFNTPTETEVTIESNLVMSNEQIPAVIQDDQGELIETDSIPTVEEVDGGLFEDADSGMSIIEGDYDDLGWSETFDVSSPEAFKEDTLNKCIYANNKYGAQCVSLSRVFWWSYADRDVSTCGTGMAKGMMDCAEQNAGDDFIIYWADQKDQIQAGDWLVFNGGKYGHIGMALGPVTNGYVTLLGENQGGRYCEGGGAATNIINININNLIGFYRPKAYVKPAPTPTPVENKCKIRTLVWGDTLSKIMQECRGKIEWGVSMDEYASHWYSLDFKPNQSVYTGWYTGTGVGLFAGDRIEYR